jgi:glucan phosphoethanolaminetransferase (alkaline phosphatase superfamily)
MASPPVDTLRADRVSAYGYSRETTPALTALAE